jgi:hypothetical protein
MGYTTAFPQDGRSTLKIIAGYLLAAIITLSGGSTVFGYESIYEKTPVGKIEVKRLPEATALATVSKQGYFDDDNGLFMQLFRYIDSNQIAMTVPVEADVKPGGMRFFVGRKHEGEAPANSDAVEVLTMPERTVVSIGVRGGYSKENFESGKSRLMQWLNEQKEWTQAGDAYPVYWNGPFVPSILKRSEVHLPVTSVHSTDTSSSPSP